MADQKIILLVEDNPDDGEADTSRVQRHGSAMKWFVAHDGVEALELSFGKRGLIGEQFEASATSVLLELKLPRRRLGVLRRLRAHERTKLAGVVT